MSSGFSIKYKLLFLLILVPVTALGIYSFVAIDLFKADKVAYVYDSTSAIASSLASQVRAEIDSVSSYARPLIAEYFSEQRRFSDFAKRVFLKEESIKYLAIHHFDGVGGYRLGGRLKKAEFKPQGNWVEGATGQNIVRRGANEVFYIQLLGQDLAVIASRNGELSEANHTVVFMIAKIKNVATNFRSSRSYYSFLVGNNGEKVTGQEGLDLVTDFSQWDFYEKMKSSNIEDRALETVGPDGEAYLISYSKVGVGHLAVVSFVRKELAFSATKVLMTKSIVFFVVILSFSFLVSVFASSRLTSSLRKLVFAAKKIAEGDYEIEIDIKSRDEVQTLAENFGFMATEVHRLMIENVEKARMEKELETAKVVQDSLFPKSRETIGSIEINGYYKSASECGGDWWHYCEIDRYAYLWIGDATGHGAPAALITSAAKSVASIIETMPAMNTSEIMTMLNRSVCENSKGRVCMTFFIARLDKESGQFQFCNASHEPPIRIPYKNGEAVKKIDLDPIISESFSRLGESLDSEYKDSEVLLEKKDLVLFYTDGVTELVSEQGMFEERRLLRSLITGVKKEEGVDGVMNQLHGDLEGFRSDYPLQDDVTYFSVEFN